MRFASQVQHYMPEHMCDTEVGCSELADACIVASTADNLMGNQHLDSMQTFLLH